ncbi:uncharacterized protein LOC21399313 [Morus notabilis]|uniref:uncharacterized protein LOC21399313 n=1 Tax=Morus notabilis TaxID=981085 RepID=UPI000CED21CA|nr:uncharacterized protein LOC21399313 [Morus notabilis]
MASIPEHFHSSLDHCYTLFPSDHLSGLPVPTAAAAVGGGGAMWGGQDDFMVPFYGENIGLVDANNNLSSSPTESFMSSSSSLPEQVGISDGVVPAFSDYRSSMMGLHGIVGAQNFGGSYNTSCVNYPQYVNANGFEFGEECCATSFLPELIKPVGLVSAQKNWGMQNNQNIHAIEESNMMKVGRYSEEERKERIVRYLKKRNQRNFNKTIKVYVHIINVN